MSRSPERISSYRRHFEDSSSSSTYQVRVSSPSPSRREVRHASIGFSARAGSSSRCSDSVGRRTMSAARRTRTVGVGISAGAMVCVGPSGEAPMDSDAAAAENQEFLRTRTNDRQEMIVSNDRSAVYIDKVRSLEQKNKLSEAEIEAYQNKFEKPSGLRLLYEEQSKESKKIADQMRVQRDISMAAKEAAAAQLQAIKIKYEEALESRKKAELDIEAFRPDVDKATSSRIALEKKSEQSEVEIEFLKRIHQQEIEELMKQIYAAHVSAESAFSSPDSAAALKQIQTQYDDIAAKNLQEMDSWYKNKFEDLTKKTSRHVDKVRSVREEIAGAKKDIQNKERDLESLRTRNEALEVQIRETQERYRKESEESQARIEASQREQKSTKEKIASHSREYQELLNIKMASEIEITTYRKLIEGEDSRLSGMMKSLSITSCSMSTIGAGVSLSGGSLDGLGGMGGGPMGASRGGTGGIAGGVGSCEDMVAGVTRSHSGVGDPGTGKGGPGGSSSGTSGLGTDLGGEGSSSGGKGDRNDIRAHAGGDTTGLAGGMGASGTGLKRGLGAETEGKNAGLDTGVGGVGFGSGGIGDSSVVETHADGGILSSAGNIGTSEAGLRSENNGEADVKSVGLDTGVGSGGFSSRSKGDSSEAGARLDSDRSSPPASGSSPSEMKRGISGATGSVGKGRDDSGIALSSSGGVGRIGGGKGDLSGVKAGYGSDGFDSNKESFVEQAVESTERRTVLIRTVKKDDDLSEMDHQEQTYTITGAADDSDEE